MNSTITASVRIIAGSITLASRWALEVAFEGAKQVLEKEMRDGVRIFDSARVVG